MDNIQRVARVIQDEEHRYATTFQVAEKMFLRRSQTGRASVTIPGAGCVQAL